MVEPVAFLSYVHHVDRTDRGAITRFREELSNEVQVQTGVAFPIFQDHVDIKWGEQWEERVKHALDSATFLIPILTPEYFRSPQCVNELAVFLEYEKALGRRDLILPVMYVARTTSGHGATAYEGQLAQEVFKHQYVDWSDLRFADRENETRRKRIQEIAIQIDSAIARTRSYLSHRESHETFFEPRGMEVGREGEPYDRVLGMDRKDPQSLLSMAMRCKKQGRYEEAKELQDELMKLPINWDRSVDLFVDYAYFSISLHDKLEDWQDLDGLERYFFEPSFARLRAVVSETAYASMHSMFEASMALAMLRQVRLDEARVRVQAALASPPGGDEGSGRQIFHANALVTRSLVGHATHVYGGGSSQLLDEVRADLEEAEHIYRTHARMGESDEFHHLGRFYGCRAFILAAECRARGGELAEVAGVLLDDARRAHDGLNRTTYGRVAGRYCHAYCLFQLAVEDGERSARGERLIAARTLLGEALAELDATASLGRCKLAGLGEDVLHAMDDPGLEGELTLFRDEREMAVDRLRSKGFQHLGQITRPEWLHTPLN